MNENRLRLVVFAMVAAIHVVLLLFVAINIGTQSQAAEESARVMKLTDFEEAPPPPPQQEELPVVEAIAETMIETEVVPDQVIVAPGSLTTSVHSWDDYLPMHRVSRQPGFDEKAILADLVFPTIAQRSGIEGRVILELFVDKNGLIQQIRILQENPSDRGFGEAAVKAFTGKRATPAYANGEPVSCRYRYPVSFKLN